MTDQFTQNALSWGEEGKRWLESIPSIISEYEKKWSIEVLPPFALSYNYVAPVKRADDTHAVLKIGFPKDEEFQSEIVALTLCDGDGLEKLLEVDSENAVILIEKVEPGLSLSKMENDDEATKIIVQVMKRIHKPLPANHQFITVAEWAKGIPKLREKFNGTTGPLPTYLVDKAEQLFKELIATSDEAVLVHGDLHHDNILSSDRVGWLAIDPKGIAAEPAYDVAAMIRNPYEKVKGIADLEPFILRRLKILSKELNIDIIRLHQWCLAQTVLSALWNVGEFKGPDHSLHVAEVLAKMKF